MMPSQTRPSVAVDIVASARRVGSGAGNPEAIVASVGGDCGNVSRVLLGDTVRAVVVWVSGPWYGP